MAHGAAEHGGCFYEVNEYTFELVGKRGSGDSADLSLYIKDPRLQPVTTGDVILQVTEAEGKVTDKAMRIGSDKAFHLTADFRRRGRYRTRAQLKLPGGKLLKCPLSLLLP